VLDFYALFVKLPDVDAATVECHRDGDCKHDEFTNLIIKLVKTDVLVTVTRNNIAKLT
jgi:hypothetical protein